MIEPDNRTVCLVDLSSLYWANWHATADMELGEAVRRTVEQVHKYADGFDLIAVCCDAPPYWRSDVCPEYKANRIASPPLAREQLRRVKDKLRADGLLMWSVDTFEADDLLATAAAQAVAAGHEVRVISADKDLLQLVGEGVTVQSPMTGVVFDDLAVQGKHGVPPVQIVDYLSLLGDKSDNVAGVPGIGPKTASALLKHFDTLENVLKAAYDGDPALTKPAIKTALVVHAAAARLARQVITLRYDVPLTWAEIYETRTPLPLVTEAANMDEGDTMLDETITQPAQPAQQPPPTESAAEVIDTPQRAAIVAQPSGDWSLGLEPSSLGVAMNLAKSLYNSRLYARFPSAEAIFAIVIRGREMGLGALTSLDSFHIIEGKPAPQAHLLIARAKAHPDCEFFRCVGGDSTFSEWETKNRHNPASTRLRYTIEQAQRAGICPAEMRALPPVGAKDARGNWEKRPDEMLRKTCGVQLARLEYPECLLGLYAVEELER